MLSVPRVDLEFVVPQFFSTFLRNVCAILSVPILFSLEFSQRCTVCSLYSNRKLFRAFSLPSALQLCPSVMEQYKTKPIHLIRTLNDKLASVSVPNFLYVNFAN